jgi:luciferase family oxidoreductase group 1
MRLSVLDTSPIVQGATPKQALENTVDLAVLADSLGYHRYWVPEHHGMRGVASSAPAVLVGHLATVTSRIRVGAGGVLLPNHAPVVVAEQFGTLEALHPGRIDLGIGRAPGGSAAAVAAVRPATERPFRSQVAELLAYLNEEVHPPAVPVLGGNAPPVWLLGSSPDSAALAAELGLPYAYAHHLTGRTMLLSHPTSLVSVSVIAAEDDDRAEWLAGSIRLKVLSRRRGTRILLPSPEEAAAHPERAEHDVIVGGPTTVRAQLQRIIDETGTTELMVTTPVYDHGARRRSYELVAAIAEKLR